MSALYVGDHVALDQTAPSGARCSCPRAQGWVVRLGTPLAGGLGLVEVALDGAGRVQVPVGCCRVLGPQLGLLGGDG
jgi:hypothetical protein